MFTDLNKHPLKQQIQKERFELFMNEVGPRMFGAGLLIFFVAIYFYVQVFNFESIIWLSLAAVTAISSYIFVKQFYRQKPAELSDEFLAKWQKFLAFIIALWVLLWGSVPFIFLSDVSAVDFITILLLIVVMSSMPSITMGVFPGVYLSFHIPVFLAFTYFIYTSGLEQANFLTAVTFLSGSLLVLFVVLIHKQQLTSIIQKVELRDLKSKLQAASQAKELLMTMMGHDLKQPIEASKLMLNVAENKTKTEVIEQMKQQIDVISSNLIQIINKAKQNKVEKLLAFENYDLEAVLQKSLNKANARLENREIEYTLNLKQSHVQTDMVLFKSIIDNILVNIIEHADPTNIEITSQNTKGVINLTFVASECRYAYPNKLKRASGHGLEIIVRLCSILDIEVVWYENQNGDEVTELRI